MKRGVTLVEVLVVAWIIGVIVVCAAAPFLAWTDSLESFSGPPPTVQATTVQHDGHWWILCRQAFAHHPDCPCLTKTAEAE